MSCAASAAFTNGLAVAARVMGFRDGVTLPQSGLADAVLESNALIVARGPLRLSRPRGSRPTAGWCSPIAASWAA